MLAGDADTPSNMVYVDNVAEAIACALVAAPSEDGRAFLISEPDQLSWKQFYQFFADAAGARIEIAPYPDARACAARARAVARARHQADPEIV